MSGPKLPAKPGYPTPGREGGKPSAAPSPQTHREAGKPQVKTK